VRVPMVDINTIGAGGGSIAWLDGANRLRVGAAIGWFGARSRMLRPRWARTYGHRRVACARFSRSGQLRGRDRCR
jgi:hypothetical protein